MRVARHAGTRTTFQWKLIPASSALSEAAVTTSPRRAASAPCRAHRLGRDWRRGRIRATRERAPAPAPRRGLRMSARRPRGKGDGRSSKRSCAASSRFCPRGQPRMTAFVSDRRTALAELGLEQQRLTTGGGPGSSDALLLAQDPRRGSRSPAGQHYGRSQDGVHHRLAAR